jgi:hypothetical protein
MTLEGKRNWNYFGKYKQRWQNQYEDEMMDMGMMCYALSMQWGPAKKKKDMIT